MKNIRIEGLDLMRSIAILLVLIGHNLMFIPIHIRNYFSPFIPDGVSFFFVLSGYLIGKILWEELKGNPIKGKDLVYFWKRRWFRTLPNYFATLIVIIILSKLLGKEIHVPLFQYFVFIQNLFTPQSEGFFPESWSLAVEEWFYILLPIFLLGFSFFEVNRLKIFLLSFLVFFLISSLYRFHIFNSGLLIDLQSFDLWIRKTVLGRLDSIFFGVTCYLLIHVLKILALDRYRFFLMISVCLFLSNELLKYFSGNFLYLSTFYFPIESIAICLSIPFFLKVKIKNSLLLKFSNITSKYSYSLYLVNFYNVKILILDSIVILNPYLNRSIKLLLFLPLSYLIASIAYHSIEKPFMKMRDSI